MTDQINSQWLKDELAKLSPEEQQAFSEIAFGREALNNAIGKARKGADSQRQNELMARYREELESVRRGDLSAVTNLQTKYMRMGLRFDS